MEVREVWGRAAEACTWEENRVGDFTWRRLCEQSPRQKSVWCFLEIEGNLILLELRWWKAGHRARDGAEEGGKNAIGRCCRPHLGFRCYPKGNGKPLEDSWYWKSSNGLKKKNQCDYHMEGLQGWDVDSKEANEECVNAKLVLETRGFLAPVQAFSALHLNLPKGLATTQRGSAVGDE